MGAAVGCGPIRGETPMTDTARAANDDAELPADVELFTEEVRADPYPLYRRLREAGPYIRSAIDPDTYILLGYDDCLAVLRDVRWSSNPSHRTLPADVDPSELDMRTLTAGSAGAPLLFIDPPDHTRLRKLVSKAFTPKRVERLRPHIQEIVDQILDEAADRGELDVVADLGYTVPVTVICELMGVPVEDRGMFGPWSSDASRLLDGMLEPEVTNAGLLGVMNIINYFNTLFEERRKAPRDDLVSALLAAEEEGDRLSEEELRSITLLLFIAGHETTMNLIGNGTKALLENPDQLARVRDDPSLVPSTI
jgi:cytochrome P450